MVNTKTIDIDILRILLENSYKKIQLNDNIYLFKFFINLYGMKIMVVIYGSEIHHILEENWHKVKVVDKEMYLN